MQLFVKIQIGFELNFEIALGLKHDHSGLFLSYFNVSAHRVLADLIDNFS